MDLPVNWPPGTRFWRLIIDAAADLTTGDFMLLDGSIVSGLKADRLREQIVRDGEEISEAAFREMAPPQRAQIREEMEARAAVDPAYAALLKEVASHPEVIKQCETTLHDMLQNAAEQEFRDNAAELLLKLAAKKQNIADQ